MASVSAGAAAPVRDADPLPIGRHRSGKVMVLMSRIAAGLKSSATLAGKVLVTPRKGDQPEANLAAPDLKHVPEAPVHKDHVDQPLMEPEPERWASACQPKDSAGVKTDGLRSTDSCGVADVVEECPVNSFHDPEGPSESVPEPFSGTARIQASWVEPYSLTSSTARIQASWSEPQADSESVQSCLRASDQFAAIAEEIQQLLPGSMIGEEVHRNPASTAAKAMHSPKVPDTILSIATLRHGRTEVNEFEPDVEAFEIRENAHNAPAPFGHAASLNSLVTEADEVLGSSPRRSLPSRLPPLSNISKKGRRLLASSNDLPTLLIGAPQACDDLPETFL